MYNKDETMRKFHDSVPDVFAAFSGQLSEADMDLLITDIPRMAVEKVEVVCIQEYPDERDWQHIFAAQQQIFRKKRAEMT